MTEDLRLDSTSSYGASQPSPVFGSDGKLHVLWEDFSYFPSQNGLYYARLNTEGALERPATRIVSGSVKPPRLFMDSAGDLNAAWLQADSVFYCKFDTSGQLLIPPVRVFYNTHYLLGLFNPEACLDSQDQIHITYRHCWGSFNGFNLGYSRVDNQGQVQIPYFALTPELPGNYCGGSHMAADNLRNLYLGHSWYQNGADHHHYRKLDPQLNTLFDILVDTATLSGGNIGQGDLLIDSLGRVAIAWAHNYLGVPLDYRSALYSIEGRLLQEQQVVVTGDDNYHPDLAAGPDGFLAFTWSGPWPGIATGKILYSYLGRPQGIGPAVSLEIVPAGATVLPASGGPLRFTLRVQNYEATAQRAQIWTVARLPDNTWYSPALAPVGLTLPPQATLSRLVIQMVPAGAPSGTYWYEGRVGIYPDSIWASDGLAFTKTGTGNSIGKWVCSGWDDGTASKPDVALPGRLRLSISPNPFNAVTTIPFDLPVAGRVELEVFDIRGARVGARHASPLSGSGTTPTTETWFPAGMHHIFFDGSDLPSGIYLCRLQGEEYDVAQKLILLK